MLNAGFAVVLCCVKLWLDVFAVFGHPVLLLHDVQVPARSTDSYHEPDNGPPTDGLVFMGLVSLVDPPREGVLEAVNK